MNDHEETASPDIVEQLMDEIRKQSNCLTAETAPSTGVVVLNQRRALRFFTEGDDHENHQSSGSC